MKSKVFNKVDRLMNTVFHAITGSLPCILFVLAGIQSCSDTKKPVATDVHWEKIGPGGGGAIFIPTFSYKSPDSFLLRCDMTGSYLTGDGGESYRQINFAGGASSFAWDPVDSNIVYIGSAYLNRSADGGKTWQQIFPAKSEISHEIFKGDHADFSLKTSVNSLYDSESGRISAIRADPLNPGDLYFSMGSWFFYSTDSGNSWKKESVQEPIEFIYTNKALLRDEVYIFTPSSIHIFNKITFRFSKKPFPEAMSTAFSFTGGMEANSDHVVFYALHHDIPRINDEESTHSEVWTSEDLGNSWKRNMHPAVTNEITGIKPSYSMISCAEFDAGNAYLITDRYEEKNNSKGFIYWYGALKTGDAGRSWEWVWKGGGGSGQYAVKDGIGVSNLRDAWAEKAFGGEYIRLMDVGVAPSDGKVAIVTDWYRTMKTVDGGRNWREIYSAGQPDGSYISRGLDVTTSYGVHFDPFDSNHIAISYTDIGYHHSFNKGKSWIRSVEGVPAEWINTCYWMVFDPDVKDKVWSVWSGVHDIPRGKMTRNPKWKERARGGVCISTDGGKKWTPEVEGMGYDSPATSIVLDPQSGPGNRTLYVSVYSKGVYKSTDDGRTWQLKNKGIEANTCAFELTLTNRGVLYVTVSATPMHKDGKKGKSFYSGAVYRSTDGAETWTKLNVADSPLFPNGIDYDRKDPDRIYLGCWADIELSDLVGGDVTRATGGNELIHMPGGIFMSENGGDTWKSIFDTSQYVYDVTVDQYHPGRLYCNTFNQAAWRSDDYGKTWERIKGYDFHWGHRIIVDQNDPEKIYITTFGSSVWHGIPVTGSFQTGCNTIKNNTGQTKNPNGRNDSWGFCGYGGGGAMFSPAVSPHDADYAYVACDMTGSFVTYNGGDSWRMFSLRGPVRFFVFDPVDPEVVYAKSIALFKSTDRGNTWNLLYPAPGDIKGIVPKGDHAEENIITNDSTRREVLAMAVDPDNSKKLYAVIEINNVVSYFSSDDQGASWRKEKELEQGIRNIFIVPSSPKENRTLYITGKNSVTVREKGIWTINPGPANVERINEFTGGFDKKQDKYIIYAISGKSYFNPGGDASGIYYTGNGGKTWENRQSNLLKFQLKNSDYPEWRSVATSPSHPEIVYISYAGLRVNRDTTCIGVAISEDFGKTWKLAWKDQLVKGKGLYSPNYSKGWIDDRFGPTWGENPFAIAVSATDPQICYTTDFGRTIKTSDGGNTWEQLYTKKKDGSGWISRGLEVTTGYCVVFDPFDKNHAFIANTDIGLMESKDGGESWTSATLDNGIPRKWINSTYWLAFDPGKKGRIWAAMSDVHDLPRPKMWRRKGIAAYRGGILESTDGGKSWLPVSNDIGEAAVTHILVDPSAKNEDPTLYACAFGKGIYKSVDGGRSWIQKNKGIEGKEPFAWRIVKDNKNSMLYLVVARRSDDGSIGNENDGAVYWSQDGAGSWTKMKLPEGTNGPMSLSIDPENPDRLLLSAWGRITRGQFSPDTGGGIYLSKDRGKTWRQVLEKDQHIHDLTFDARNNTFYACGFEGSAYRSEDRGETWIRIRGYNFKWGKRVDPDPGDPEKIFIVTFGGGVWYGPARGDKNATEDIVTPVLVKK